MRTARRFSLGRVLPTLLLSCVFFSACKEPALITLKSRLSLEPNPLVFPSIYPGQSTQAILRLGNAGTRTQSVRMKELEAPFSADGFPEEVAPGVTPVTLRLRPEASGLLTKTLEVEDEWGQSLSVELRATILAPPTCPRPLPCHRVEFDSQAGRCVDTLESDGLSCDPHTVCLLSSTCQQGQCLGTARVCNDGNACTQDVCNAVSGCEFLPRPPCPGDGECQVGVCNPLTGCGLAQASEGTVCGTNVTCDAAPVCIGGQCVMRDPPDNFVCAPGSPCQSEGRCLGSTCVQPAATTLLSSWHQDSLDTPPNTPPPEYHDFTVDPSGVMSTYGFSAFPIFRANTVTPVQGQTPARRCQMWNGRLLCADYPSVFDSGTLSAINAVTATIQWSYDIHVERPDFARQTQPGRFFMARMAALGSDRLAVLFEAYPNSVQGETECRLYFLVLLDAGGGSVFAQRLDDPFLQTCNHPHPYGFTADTVGNLYISFSGSLATSTPLQSQAPSLLLSFTREGALRWRREEAYRAGELAVAQGIVYPEWASSAHVSASGALAFSALAGRPVVTSTTLVPSPIPGGSSALVGLSPSTGTTRWTTPLPAGHAFASEVIRLSEIKARPEFDPEPTVLSWLDVVGGPLGRKMLWATRARDGAPVWMCPVEYSARGSPALFEVTQNQVTLMDGAQTCGRCDPPFAQSSAQFSVFTMNGVGASLSSWPGTMGGPGHEHQERPSYNVPFNFSGPRF